MNKKTITAMVICSMTLSFLLTEAYCEEEGDKKVTFPDKILEEVIRKEIGKPSESIYMSDLEKITHLHVYFPTGKASNLEGLQYCRNLESLEIDDSDVSDISPLANLTNLKKLDLGGNNVSDISPLADLTNLTNLSLSGNNISDISPLANLTNLKKLDIGGNNISDISPLAELTNLQELNLGYNSIFDISPLADLTTLKELDLSGNNISDLSSLINLPYLITLRLGRNNISDISPLADLTNLTILDLSWNIITDISPLSNLSGLEKLSLEGNENIVDLSTLAELKSLTELDLSRCKITDISFLTDITALRGLDLEWNSLSKISPLASLTNLQWLNLGHNEISNITTLANLTNLEALHLHWNKIKDVSSLSSLTKLTSLDLSYNRISDISPLLDALTDSNMGLNRIEIVGNPLSSESINTYIPELKRRGFNVRWEPVGEKELHLKNFFIYLWALDVALVIILVAYILKKRLKGAETKMSRRTLVSVFVLGLIVSSSIVCLLREHEKNIIVTIPDETLERQIRAEIGKLEGPIYREDLKAVTRISAAEQDIRTLEGLQYCVNLRAAELWWNDIAYIPDLSDLDRLEYLQLNGNFISDISGLSGLENIEVLILGGNNISDISPLADLTTLKELDLGGNNISDISPLKNLTSLEWLFLSSNNITDISPLSNLTNLREIYLSDNDISDVSSLSNLPNLEEIYLSNNKISDLSPLVENLGIDEGDEVIVSSNRLNAESIENYIPELEKRGVTIIWEGKTFYMTLHIEKVEEIPEYFVEITEEDLDNCLLLREIFEEMEIEERESIDKKIEDSTVFQILKCRTSKYMEKYGLPMVGERCTVKYRGAFYLVELREE